MSEEKLGIDYFERIVEEKCVQMRLAALRLYQVESQMEILKERKSAEMRLLARLQEDLQDYTTSMGKAFGLGEGWSVAVDTGKLMPPQAAKGSDSKDP